jgi:hypothetical protein
MPTTITVSPTATTAGAEVTLGIAGAGAGRVGEFEVLSVPSGSAIPIGRILDANGNKPVPTPASPSTTFTPDVAGVYGLRACIIRVRDGTGGAHLDDPMGVPSRRLVASVDDSLYVGQAMDLPIRTLLGHGATLRLIVVNATIRSAELVDPLTDISRVAILDASVVAALAALVGVGTAAGVLDVDFATDVDDLRTKYLAHLTDGAHAGSDTTNITTREAVVGAIVESINVLNDLYDAMAGHMHAGTGGGTWHGVDDGYNAPLTGKARTLAEAIVMKADLRERVYERHRVQTGSPTVHPDGTDTTNTMAAPLPLPATIVAVLDAVAHAAPTAPTGEQQGVANLEHLFGFAPMT